VSLSWRERILVALEPRAVHAVRVKDGEKRTAAGPWQEALKQVIAGWPVADVTVVASNRLMRYAVVPRTAGVSGEAEELALARHHFTRIHGERARHWDVRFSRQTGLASAVDMGLLQEVRDGLKPLRLASLQPYLMAAFNALRARVPAEGAWIVLPEAEATCVALFVKGAWVGVSVSRTKSAEAVERERLRIGSAQAPRTVLMPPGNDGYAMAMVAH
jgi:hypothetical protein